MKKIIYGIELSDLELHILLSVANALLNNMKFSDHSNLRQSTVHNIDDVDKEVLQKFCSTLNAMSDETTGKKNISNL